MHNCKLYFGRKVPSYPGRVGEKVGRANSESFEALLHQLVGVKNHVPGLGVVAVRSRSKARRSKAAMNIYHEPDSALNAYLSCETLVCRWTKANFARPKFLIFPPAGGNLEIMEIPHGQN